MPVAIDLSRAGEDADRWPALIAAHEVGHYLDQAGISGYAEDPGEWESYARRTPEMRAAIEKIMETLQYRRLRDAGDIDRTWPWELWHAPMRSTLRGVAARRG